MVDCRPTKAGLTLHDFELTATCDSPPPPQDADIVMTTCNVRPSAMPTGTIPYI